MTSSKNIPDGDLSLSIEALKRKVLDAAVRGELTEQLAEDGTAKDLLIQISDEKKRLVAEGKIKKEKALPAISDEEIPFEIPENWEWVRLGDICRKLTDGTHNSPPNSTVGDFKYISAKNIKESGIDLTEVTYVSTEVHKEIYARCNPEYGDILFIKDGATTGIVTINTLNEEFSLLSSVALLKLSENINVKYILYTMRSPYFQEYTKKDMSGTAISRTTLTKLEKALIILPPLAEQRRIVEKIDEAFHQLDELKKLQDAYSSNLDALRKKVIEEGIKGNLTERLRDDGTAAELLKEIEAEKQELIKAGKIKKEKPLPEITDEEKPFEIPESWEWVRLSDLVVKNIKRGKAPKYSETGNTLVFAQKCNLKAGGINLNLAYYLNEDILSRYPEDEFLQDGDIIINCTGTGTLGRIGIFRDSDRIDMMKVVPDSHITTVRSSNKILSQYLYYYLKSIQKTIEEVGEGSTNQKELKPLSIMSLMIPLPPLAEQRRIVKKIEEVLTLIK